MFLSLVSEMSYVQVNYFSPADKKTHVSCSARSFRSCPPVSVFVWKRNFSKTLSRVEIFENTVFVVSACGW